MEPPSHYLFVASGPDDPNAPQEDKSKEIEVEVEKTPEKPQVRLLLICCVCVKILGDARSTFSIITLSKGETQASFQNTVGLLDKIT